MKSPIFTGYWGKCHIQGIAVDKKNGYIYYSFTTKLIKATLEGNIIGSVEGLIGHLGCIAFNENDGYVYGSLEYKNDSIGKGILSSIGSSESISDGFYLVRFNASEIDRIGINAENSNIMSAVFLKEVTDDYNGTGYSKKGEPVAHKYGCSGIDGVTFAPLPSQNEDEGMYLYIAYGIYSDINRNDNNHQIILCYDTSDLEHFFEKLDQKNMHKNGPAKPFEKYFVYTGNTCYGVQNLEYDSFTKSVFMAVYKGKKPEFPNYSLFAVDMECPSKEKFSEELNENIKCLTLKKTGEYDEKSGIYGWSFPCGATGLYAFGDGNWLVCHENSTPEGQCGYIYRYKWNKINPFEKV